MTEEPRAGHARSRTNLADVAARAGVSLATASRSLRGVGKVAPETRRRVSEAARELDYGPTPRLLAPEGRGRRTVAVIVPFITRWYFATAAAAALDQLRAHGYDALVYHLGNSDARDEFFDRMPLAGKVEGIISLSMPLTERHTLSLRALGLPLVSIGSEIPGAGVVGIDDVQAARLAVTHLTNLGHRRIGMLIGRPEDPRFDFAVSAGRRRGYSEALAAAGLSVDPDVMPEGSPDVQGGADAMTQLLSRTALPSAVFAENDEMAIGALWVLRRAGLRTPHDVSVIGIDDMELARFHDLTTIAQDVPDQGRAAADLLLQALDADEAGEATVAPRVEWTTRLVLRSSTARPADPGAERH